MPIAASGCTHLFTFWAGDPPPMVTWAGGPPVALGVNRAGSKNCERWVGLVKILLGGERGPWCPPKFREGGGGLRKGAPRATGLFPQCKGLKILAPTCLWGGGRGGKDLLERLTSIGGAPLCDIPSGRCFFTGPWTVPRSSLRMLRRVAAFCRPLRPVLLLVSFPRSRSPVVGVPGLC